MRFIPKTDETIEELATNVAIIAHCLKEDGIDIEKLDMMILDCWNYIKKKVAEMKIRPETAFNVENEIIMGLMLGILRRQSANRKETAKAHGIPVEMIDRENITQMEALLEKNGSRIEKG